MLNRSASLAMSTSVLKTLPGKLDIKRHSPSILYVSIPVLCILTYFSEEGLLITLLEWCPCSHVAICVLRQLENLKPIRVRCSVMHEKVK